MSAPPAAPAFAPWDGGTGVSASALPEVVHLGRDLCGVLEQAERREWWLTNGRGSYAAGTVAGSLTRRYHGLLTATLAPPLGRFLTFAKADPVLIDGDRQWPLFTNRWAGGTVEPAGHRHLADGAQCELSWRRAARCAGSARYLIETRAGKRPRRKKTK